MGRADPVEWDDTASPVYQEPGDNVAHSFAAFGKRLIFRLNDGAGSSLGAGSNQFRGGVQAVARCRAVVALVGAAGAWGGGA